MFWGKTRSWCEMKNPHSSVTLTVVGAWLTTGRFACKELISEDRLLSWLPWLLPELAMNAYPNDAMARTIAIIATMIGVLECCVLKFL